MRPEPEVAIERSSRQRCLLRSSRSRSVLPLMGQVKSKLRNAMCGGGPTAGGPGNGDAGASSPSTSGRRIGRGVGDVGIGFGSDGYCSDDEDVMTGGRSSRCDRACCAAARAASGAGGSASGGRSRLHDSCGSGSISGGPVGAELVVLGPVIDRSDCSMRPSGGGVVTVTPAAGGEFCRPTAKVDAAPFGGAGCGLETVVGRTGAPAGGHVREVQVLRHNYNMQQQQQMLQHRVR